MEISVNGEKRKVSPDTYVVDLLNTLGFNTETVVVESDGIILKREEYETHILKNDMKLELIRFVAGG